MHELPLKPFEEMTPADYADIGFMGGLEVHQQLLTRRKLFCRCPAGRYSSEYDAEILRHMRPTLSEMGEYDGTALMEKKTRKNIYYRIHRDTVCTYEFDDTPPFLIDDEAVDIAIEISMLLRLGLVDELHIARKQYLDGSIPTGFQRTAIFGIDGHLPFEGRRIGVRQLSIEEDSCREVSDEGHDRTYLTDRLGMPLIEVVTEPDMRTPQELASVCCVIGKLCRSTGKVRRGYGATRQDVNVSVRGGTRVEIKGVPQFGRIPRLAYNEASRQVALLRIRDELKRRGVTPETIRWEERDVTRKLSPTSFAPIRDAIAAGKRVRCVLLRGFGGLLNVRTQEYTTFAKEFSDRVRVIACLTQLPNIAYGAETSESLWARDWQALRKRTKARREDELVVVWGDERDVRTACEEIAIRAREATEGVPSDTRQPLKAGTTGFERVLPGAERMYPDTDLPPIPLAPDRLDRIRAGLPDDVWDTEEAFRAAGMAAHDAGRLCISPRAALARECIDRLGLDGALVGVVLAQRTRALRRAGHAPDRVGDADLRAIFEAHAAGRLAREGVPLLLTRMAAAPGAKAGALLEELGEPASDGEIERAIDGAVARHDPDGFASSEAYFEYVMGLAMVTLRGRAEGRLVATRLRARLEESKR